MEMAHPVEGHARLLRYQLSGGGRGGGWSGRGSSLGGPLRREGEREKEGWRGERGRENFVNGH